MEEAEAERVSEEEMRRVDVVLGSGGGSRGGRVAAAWEQRRETD